MVWCVHSRIGRVGRCVVYCTYLWVDNWIKDLRCSSTVCMCVLLQCLFVCLNRTLKGSSKVLHN